MGTCDNTAIVSFSPDIFFEVTRLFSYKSILLKFWEVYKERVKEVKEIIERVGLMKM